MISLNNRQCFCCSFYCKTEQVFALWDNTKADSGGLTEILLELN